MPIWSAEIKELEKLYESFKGQFPDVEKELERLIKADDENMILLYSRRCLEVIVTDLCECELKRSRKTEPLQGVIDKLHKEEKVPFHIIASMQSLNTLSTFGAHPKDFDPEQVKPVLINLDIIIKWYLRYKEPVINIKVKPVEQARQEIKSLETERKSFQISKNLLIWSLSGLILLIMIVVAVLFFTNPLEKSIAVLPFINESTVDSNKHFINGIKDEILNNLQAIEGFRVTSRTSTDQYQGIDRPTLREIAKKLGVNYIVEGSGQKYGDNFRLTVQLIKVKGKEDHVWGDFFQREITKTSDIFSLQSQIARAIAAKLKVALTPEEKQLIEKIPTTSLDALDYYQMGREEEGKFPYHALTSSSTLFTLYNPSDEDKQALEIAERMYRTSLKYDSTFAPAYSGLASIYWGKNYYKNYFSDNFLDSVLILAGKALSFDDQLPDAYNIRAMYYSERGLYKQAHENFDKTLKLNPNYWLAYYGLGSLFFNESDYVNAIENYQKAAERHWGSGIADVLQRICLAFYFSGNDEKAREYAREALKQETDSVRYYFWQSMFENDTLKKFEFLKKGYAVDSTNNLILEYLSSYYEDIGQFDESLRFYRKLLDRLKEQGITRVNYLHRIGYTLSKAGFTDSANYYFNKQIEYCNNAIRLGRHYGVSFAYYDLAATYAFMGNKIKAYENLKIFNLKQRMPVWVLKYIKTDPLFNSIRNESKFQQIVKDVESKYQAEHERVRNWLEEKGML